MTQKHDPKLQKDSGLQAEIQPELNLGEQDEIHQELQNGDANNRPNSAKSTSKSVFYLLGLMFRGLWRISRIAIIAGFILGSLLAAAYVLKLDDQVTSQFEGKRWALPARVFARPLELYEGQTLFIEDLKKELQLLNYSYVTKTVRTGQYEFNKNRFIIQTRGFKFAEDNEITRRILIQIDNGKITQLENIESKEPLTLMRLEPVLIGNFYPRHNEDRVLVRLGDVSPLLTKGLVAVEDKHFTEHVGVNPKSIMRALLANIKAGENVQGGSTLTQQLVKNFYLSNERSYKRKINEATMALLLEVHYSKDEILEAYMNEIYLGQNKRRAIHGFGLASQFYFNRPIGELQPEQIALLIGLAKGASYYDPRRHPKRALARRNLVLEVMAREGALEQNRLVELKSRPLGVTTDAPPSVSPFPAFLEVVKTQLQRDYQEEDLRSEGLIVFTSMDPVVQLKAENVLKNGVEKLEKSRRIPKNKLNGAMLVTTVQGAEILAIVGGRDARLAGYNRAMNASRQIGSLVKPAVYLAALEAKQYSLASPIDGGPVTVKLSKTKLWKPKNYSGKDLGTVTFENALVKSMNTPTVRIGINLGLNKVIDMLHALGVQKEIAPNPSLLLGAIQLTPMEVQQMYQTIASGGTYTQLKAIRSVMNSYGKTLKRYPLRVAQVASPEDAYLLTYALNKVTKVGTAQYLSAVLPASKNAAGKTGTTNDDIDSWFAGFTGQHVISIWVGRDDNKSTGLTGASGALRVWAEMLKSLPTKPLKPVMPKDVHYVKVDNDSGLLYNPECGKPLIIPFKIGTEPQQMADCTPLYVEQEDSGVWSDINSPSSQPVWNTARDGEAVVWDNNKRVQQQSNPPANPQVKEVYRSRQAADAAARAVDHQWTPPSRSQEESSDWIGDLIKR